MKNFPIGKVTNILPPAAIVDNAAFTFAITDTINGTVARFMFFLGAIDIAFAVLPKIQESDASDMAGAADITGAVVAAVATTDDNKILVIDVLLDGRKRYMRPAATGGDGAAGTYMAAISIVMGLKVDPVSVAGYGVGQWVQA